MKATELRDEQVMSRETTEMSETTSAGARVELDSVSMYYGERKITNSISLDVEPGQVVSIVGPSGCGKTTLLRAVAGLNTPGEGQVRVDGSVVDGKTSPGVSMVFQHFALFPWKTVVANIAYAQTIAGVPRKQAFDRAHELIQLVGLSGFENAYPHQLSGGMQQRTGLARALAIEPRVLLMDEPFGALDAQTKEVLQFELLDLWSRSQVTTLFVTHSIDEAVLFGDKIAVLRGKPSNVVELIEVDLPSRTGRESTRSPEFVALRDHVWELVMASDVPAGAAA